MSLRERERKKKTRLRLRLYEKVKCSVVHTKASCNEWPYPTMGTTISSSPRMGLYAHPTSKAAVLPSHPPSMRVASFSRPASYDLGTVESQHAFPTRQSFAMDQSVNYEDDSTVPYNNAHSSAYTLPGTPSTVLVDYFGPSWNPKAWYPVLPVSKISTGGLYPDQDAGGHLAQSTYSYIVSGQGTAPADIPSLFPAVTPLPSEGQGTDRTLPNPAGRNQLQSDASALVTMSEGVSGFPFSQDFKIGNNWAAKSAATSTSNRTQIPTIPTGTFSSSPVNRTKPSPSNTQDLMFDFLPMPTSSGSPPSLSSSATFTELDSVDSPDEFRTNIDARYARATRAFSRDHGLPDCSPIYSYSTSDSRKNHGDDAGDSVPTLINGLPYTRVRHADTHGALSFNLLPPDPLADYRAVTEVHRTSVAPLSNPVGF